MDIITTTNDSKEFEAVYIETVEEESTGNVSTIINRIVFSETFANSLKQYNI